MAGKPGFTTLEQVAEAHCVQAEDAEYYHHGEPGHWLVTETFANAILHGEKLIATAVEGIHSLTLGNAIMLSSFLEYPVELPFDEEAYAEKLEELIEGSRFQKEVREIEVADFDQSF